MMLLVRELSNECHRGRDLRLHMLLGSLRGVAPLKVRRFR